MVEKTPVENIASVAIIYPASDPSILFIDRKDNGYPILAFRQMLCPIGGNWIGESALSDRNPYDTWCREVSEELSLDARVVSTQESQLVGDNPQQASYIVAKNDVRPTDTERAELERLKKVFMETAQPFGDFRVTVPKSVLDRVPGNTRPGYSALFPYWLVPVNEEDWTSLVKLHEKFGNLSIESVAVIVSLDQIISEPIYTCCGHDRILQRFFREMGCAGADRYPLLEDITYEYMGMPMDSYADYLDRYEILRKP